MEKKYNKVVLAYSGGLDTSVLIPWLKEHYGCEVIAVSGNVGQGTELDGLEEKALKTGASKLYIEDLTKEFVDDYIIPTMKVQPMSSICSAPRLHARSLLSALLKSRSRKARTQSATAAPARATTRSVSNWRSTRLHRRWISSPRGASGS